MHLRVFVALWWLFEQSLRVVDSAQVIFALQRQVDRSPLYRAERQRAEQAEARAEQAEIRMVQERQRAERYAALLEAAGLRPPR